MGSIILQQRPSGPNLLGAYKKLPVARIKLSMKFEFQHVVRLLVYERPQTLFTAIIIITKVLVQASGRAIR